MRHGTESLIYIFIFFFLALTVVLISSYAGKAAIDSGSTQTEGTAASLSPGAAQSNCTIFCGRYISKSDEEKKKAKCVTCSVDGKGISFVCDDNDAANKCSAKESALKCASKTASYTGSTCYDILQKLKSSAGTGTGTGVVSTLPGTIYLYELEGSTKIPVSKINFRNGQFSGVNDVYVGVKKADGTDMSFDSLDLQLQQAGTAEDANKNCGLTADGKPAGLACMKSTLTSFKLPVNPMKDSDSYGILITAKQGSSTLAQVSWPFSWRCPEIKLGGDFGAGYEMTAEFESEIGSKDDVTLNIKPKGSTAAGTTWNPDGAAGRTANFKLPKLGAGVIEGENLLTIIRKDKGLCIKTEGTTDVVKNELSVIKPWGCPETGCSRSEGSKGDENNYVVKTKQNGGGYVDFQTGCSYGEKVEPKCAHGCTKGKCKLPDLQITSIAIDSVDIETGTVFEDRAYDRFITVSLKNAGSWTAYDIEGSAKLSGADLSFFDFNNPKTQNREIAPGDEAALRFILPKRVPDVRLPVKYLPQDLSASVSGSDVRGGQKADANDADNKYQKTVNFYNSCCTSSGSDPCAAFKTKC